MNYNQRNPIFSFRLSDYRKSKLDKLAKLDKTSANEVARKIIDKYLANELIEKTEDLDKEMIKLRIEKLKAENEKLKMELAESPAEAPINTNKFSSARPALSRKEYNKLSRQERFLYNLNK